MDKIISLDENNNFRKYNRIGKFYLKVSYDTEDFVRNIRKIFNLFNIDEDELYIELA